MPTKVVTVSIELKERMDALDTIKWGAVARNAFLIAVEEQEDAQARRQKHKRSAQQEEDDEEIDLDDV